MNIELILKDLYIPPPSPKFSVLSLLEAPFIKDQTHILLGRKRD